MSTATATYRVNYSDYMNDVTGSPKSTVKAGNTGIAHLNNPFVNRQNQVVQQTGVMPHYGGGAEKCARCSKSVYLAEKKVGAGRSFHSSCFSCQTCNRKLDATALSEHKGEIFCKTCYTRQFGVHGLISGVTMSTEQPAREIRHSRRSSYGSDLDAPVITHKQVRPRAHSNDNMLRGENSAIIQDEVPKLFPWRNDVLPEQHLSPSPTKQMNHGVDNIIDKQYERPISQIGFGKVIESAYTEQDDQQKYEFKNEKPFYNNGTSAIIDMPVISPPKRLDSNIERMEMPTVPTRDDERSRSPSPSPSPTSTDNYRQQTSRERQSDISDNFARLTLNEMNSQLYPHDHITTNMLASENPILKQTSSHDNKEIVSNTNHSHDLSPPNRSPSPTSGYGSSSVHGEGISRDSTSSPPSAFVPQHDYLNTRSSNSNELDRHPSPKTNNLPSPSIGGKYSTIAALIKPHRPLSQLNTPNDDELDN